MAFSVLLKDKIKEEKKNSCGMEKKSSNPTPQSSVLITNIYQQQGTSPCCSHEQWPSHSHSNPSELLFNYVITADAEGNLNSLLPKKKKLLL